MSNVCWCVCDDSCEKRSIHNVSSCRVSVKTTAHLSFNISELNVTCMPSYSCFLPISSTFCLRVAHMFADLCLSSPNSACECVWQQEGGGVRQSYAHITASVSPVPGYRTPITCMLFHRKNVVYNYSLGSMKMVRVSPEYGCAAEMLREIMSNPPIESRYLQLVVMKSFIFPWVIPSSSRADFWDAAQSRLVSLKQV